MSRAELLTRVLALEGVTSAALAPPGGELFTLPGEAGALAAAAEALRAYLSTDRVLAELLGAEQPSQTVLEFSSGTLLLSQTVLLEGEPCSVVALLAARDLNRVRFGLRRLLPPTSAASPSPLPRRERLR